MQNAFTKIKKNFGFGCMRLPMTENTESGEKAVDAEEFTKMVDAFMERGFNYFDTAHGYLGGKSETALRQCLTSRYPREDYVLVNKLSGQYFSSEEDIIPFFESQLEACGVEYFDFYLMHAQNAVNFEKYKACRAYETALSLKAQGRIKGFGISFHDNAETLDRILTEYPQIEVVQIQFNYLDYDDPTVQSKRVYDVCRKHGKPIIVMEPVKGGSLVNLPDKAKGILDSLEGGSAASYAIRFAAGFEGVFMVLSGMGNMDMMNDNLSYMERFVPLDDRELKAIDKVRGIFKEQDLIPCTACEYCIEKCPMNIPIPKLFACMNDKKTFMNWNADFYYGIVTKEGAGASDCVGCGNCEALCPQQLPIRELLRAVADEFEGKKR